MNRSKQRGFTLVEAGTTVAILAIAATQAFAGFGDMLGRRHVEGVAAELATDLQYVRTETVQRHAGVRVSFDSDGAGGSCYVIHTGPADACSCGSGSATCAGDAQLLKAVHTPAGSGAQITANVASMLYDPLRGTATPAATITVTAADGRSMRHVVNILGRVRSCAPVGGLPGYKAC